MSKEIEQYRVKNNDGEEMLVSFVPLPEFDCNHKFKKTEPSKLDEHGVLLWECVFCHKQVSST